MYTQLQNLYDELEKSIPKYAISSCAHVNINSTMSQECKSMLDHLRTMPEVKVTHNAYGMPIIKNTTIHVESIIGSRHFIVSRYGRIEIPVKVVK